MIFTSGTFTFLSFSMCCPWLENVWQIFWRTICVTRMWIKVEWHCDKHSWGHGSSTHRLCSLEQKWPELKAWQEESQVKSLLSAIKALTRHVLDLHGPVKTVEVSRILDEQHIFFVDCLFLVYLVSIHSKTPSLWCKQFLYLCGPSLELRASFCLSKEKTVSLESSLELPGWKSCI